MIFLCATRQLVTTALAANRYVTLRAAHEYSARAHFARSRSLDSYSPLACACGRVFCSCLALLVLRFVLLWPRCLTYVILFRLLYNRSERVFCIRNEIVNDFVFVSAYRLYISYSCTLSMIIAGGVKFGCSRVFLFNLKCFSFIHTFLNHFFIHKEAVFNLITNKITYLVNCYFKRGSFKIINTVCSSHFSFLTKQLSYFLKCVLMENFIMTFYFLGIILKREVPYFFNDIFYLVYLCCLCYKLFNDG